MDITALLAAWSSGDEEALAELMPLVYGELRRLASSYLRRESGESTLETTALVHEAFLRLVDQERVHWQSRTHFFGIAARMMRRILVDHAREHLYLKRGGGTRTISLDEAPIVSVTRAPEVVALDDALSKFHEEAPEEARIVELRYFGGMTSEEIAALLGISVPTVTRRWRFAKAWLYRHLLPS